MIAPEKLKQLKLFQDFSEEALEQLSKDMEGKVFPPGKEIIKEGGTSQALYIVGSGLVTVNKSFGKKKKDTKVVARLEAGNFFGEMAFLENQPHSATVVAQDETEVFMLPRKTINTVLKKDPNLAVNHILTLLSGVSFHLRRTTQELVTVFEVARLIGQASDLRDLFTKVMDQLVGALGEAVSIGFYQWNMFNEEYTPVVRCGPAGDILSTEIEASAPLLSSMKDGMGSITDVAKPPHPPAPLDVKEGHVLISQIDYQGIREGLLVCYSQTPAFFSRGERQLVDTVSAVLAPALETIKQKEEEAAKRRLEQGRQGGYSL